MPDMIEGCHTTHAAPSCSNIIQHYQYIKNITARKCVHVSKDPAILHMYNQDFQAFWAWKHI